MYPQFVRIWGYINKKTESCLAIMAEGGALNIQKLWARGQSEKKFPEK